MNQDRETQFMSKEICYIRRDDLAAVDMDGETVMMDLASGAYFGLNGSAGHLWDALATPQSANDLCQCLLTRYEVDTETCQRDVAKFLEQLEGKGLIKACA